MNTGREALILFYGIFWATSLSMVAKYRLFYTAAFFNSDNSFRVKVRKRFLLALFVIDLLPIAWLYVLYAWIVPNKTSPWAMVSAAIASLSVFGFPRILHSLIAIPKRRSIYYSKEEWEKVEKDIPPQNPDCFHAHFIPGFLYLLGGGFFAWSAGYFQGLFGQIALLIIILIVAKMIIKCMHDNFCTKCKK
jgi:hypothetical protein